MVALIPESEDAGLAEAVTSLPDPHVPDWNREALAPGEYNPGKMLLRALRTYARFKDRRDPAGRARSKWAVLQHRIWSAVCGADIPLGSRIGGGLLIPHPQGVVIHPDAEIGPNCLIMSNVTIGVTRAGGVPSIGGGVDIGTGAKILGPVKIGVHAQIGANAVVVTDIPNQAVALGIPARSHQPR